MALLASLFLALLALLFLLESLQPLTMPLLVLWIVLGAWSIGRLKLLIKDWLVFVPFLILLDLLRGTVYVLTCRLGLPVHVLYVLRIEKALFGGVPSVALQNIFLRSDPQGPFSWLEKILTVFYGSHYISFLFVGLFIWLYRPEALAKYRTSFYFLISLGVLIYALVPTAAPWTASNLFGLLPPLNRFSHVILESSAPVLTGGFDLNPVAAMPSLHAAFPILSSLLLWGLCRWKALPFCIYTLIILFAIVYTGDHYVTDVLAGLVLAAGCYLVAGRFGRVRNTAAREGPASGGNHDVSWVALKRPILAGAALFLAAGAAAFANKALIPHGINLHDLNVPKYADFFSREESYGATYPIQLYLGNHALAWNDPDAALPRFERSLKLARSREEREVVRSKIDLCRQAADKKDINRPPREEPRPRRSSISSANR